MTVPAPVAAAPADPAPPPARRRGPARAAMAAAGGVLLVAVGLGGYFVGRSAPDKPTLATKAQPTPAIAVAQVITPGINPTAPLVKSPPSPAAKPVTWPDVLAAANQIADRLANEEPAQTNARLARLPDTNALRNFESIRAELDKPNQANETLRTMWLMWGNIPSKLGLIEYVTSRRVLIGRGSSQFNLVFRRRFEARCLVRKCNLDTEAVDLYEGWHTVGQFDFGEMAYLPESLLKHYAGQNPHVADQHLQAFALITQSDPPNMPPVK